MGKFQFTIVCLAVLLACSSAKPTANFLECQVCEILVGSGKDFMMSQEGKDLLFTQGTGLCNALADNFLQRTLCNSLAPKYLHNAANYLASQATIMDKKEACQALKACS